MFLVTCNIQHVAQVVISTICISKYHWNISAISSCSTNKLQSRIQIPDLICTQSEATALIESRYLNKVQLVKVPAEYPPENQQECFTSFHVANMNLSDRTHGLVCSRKNGRDLW